MTQITDPENCTGCQACRLICPGKCISIAGDREGFLVPEIDQSRCMDCGQCVLRCPQNNRPAFTNNTVLKVIAARYKDDEVLGKSSSGGAFAGIAAKILETPGSVVFGCAFDKELVARHDYVTDKRNIEPLQSSKYVQSDVGDTYLLARDLLENGKTVLYSGTPCQIAGLYAFTGRDYENLLTADLMCHGVSSPLLFKRYIAWLEKKLGGRVINYNFRYKSGRAGWSPKCVTRIMTNRKVKYIERAVDPYSRDHSNYTLRESCYRCKYTNANRIGDLTLGDFWGIENASPDFFDRRGVSAVCVNTPKGERSFNMACGDFYFIESAFEKISNMCLYEPTQRPKIRDGAYNGVGDAQNNIFSSPLFKISRRTYIKTYFTGALKRILPQAVLKLYSNVKQRKDN